MTEAREWNFDGIVGPTHHYGGLGLGNLASHDNRARPADPKAAALQGIAKLKLVAALGIPQAVLPPHERPSVRHLRSLGFDGTDHDVVRTAARHAPDLLSALSSASAMWTANAATVSPSADTGDGRVHLTPANLSRQLHRSVEAGTTTEVLRAVFPDRRRVLVHDPLPPSTEIGDEGAANHGRIVASHGAVGVEVFVHGTTGTTRFPARQTRTASEAVARRHGLEPRRVVHATQAARAIDAGVFHNDVIAVVDRDILLLHEDAYDDTEGVLRHLTGVAEEVGVDLRVGLVPAAMLDLPSAVASYLFNSQLLSLPNGRRALVAPADVDTYPGAVEALAGWSALVDEVHRVDLRQSMRNGGGPACLRLRVVLTDAEEATMATGVVVDAALADQLEDWVREHYRDRLVVEDLGDPALLDEGRVALDELTGILGLGSVYDFQRP